MMWWRNAGVAAGATVPLSTAIATPSLVVLDAWGDSIQAGTGGSSVDGGVGPREAMQRTLLEGGVRFRLANGLRGWGGLNGSGTTWGKVPNTQDFYELSPQVLITDWRTNGHGGRTLQSSTVVTNVDTSTDTITAPGHVLSDGAPLYLTSTGTIPTFAGVVQPILFAANCNPAAGTFQATQYDGTAVLDITGAGSGTITVGVGLGNLVPGMFQLYDALPTDIVVGGGMNDITALVAAGTPDALTVLQGRFQFCAAAFDTAAPGARKYAESVTPAAPNLTNYAGVEALRASYNAWLATYVPTRGSQWCFVDIASKLTAAGIKSDGLHPFGAAHEIIGITVGRAVIHGSGASDVVERRPFPFRLRTPAASVNVGSTAQSVQFPAQSSLNAGANSWFASGWYLRHESLTSTASIWQIGNPFSGGACLLQALGQLQLYVRSATPCVPASTYTQVLLRGEWLNWFVFVDRVRSEVGLWINGQLAQRVRTTLSDLPNTDHYFGGAGLASAVGLFKEYVFGFGDLSIEDAGLAAYRLYRLGEEPPGTQNVFTLGEGSGSPAGRLSGSTAAVLSSATWMASGRYPRRVDQGYVQPEWHVRPGGTITASGYAAFAGELVEYDASGGAMGLSIPTPVGIAGQRIALKEVGNSATGLTVTPDAGLIDGGATLVLNTARAGTVLVSDGANWQRETR